MRKSIEKDKQGTNQIPPKGYVLITLGALVIAILMLLFYTDQIFTFNKAQISNQIYYLLLIPFALSASAFLFGAMKSYGAFTGNTIHGTLELGGPIIAFVLVIVFGFKLVPSAPGTFSFIVTLRAEKSVPETGAIGIYYGGSYKEENIGKGGVAKFTDISDKFRGDSTKLTLKLEKYRLLKPHKFYYLADKAEVKIAIDSTQEEGKKRKKQTHKESNNDNESKSQSNEAEQVAGYAVSEACELLRLDSAEIFLRIKHSKDTAIKKLSELKNLQEIKNELNKLCDK